MVCVVSNEKSYFERNVIEAYMLENPKVIFKFYRICMKNYQRFLII